MTEYLRKVYPANKPRCRLILAHGAGAGNQHEFMDTLSLKLSKLGIEVISFNFPYMQSVYETDKKRPPNSNKVLQQYFIDEILQFNDGTPLFIAGKSMGGRVASQVMASDTFDSDFIKGLIVYGYPFIPPGKPEKLEERTKHLADIKVASLIVQGERDTFGGLGLLESIELPILLEVNWITNGDHSFKPLKSSGITWEENMDSAVEKTLAFINVNL